MLETDARPAPSAEGRPWRPADARFPLGARVRKTKGSSWHGRVVGFYSTALTPIGYAIESEREMGSVQIYPEAALEAWDGPAPAAGADADRVERWARAICVAVGDDPNAPLHDPAKATWRMYEVEAHAAIALADAERAMAW